MDKYEAFGGIAANEIEWVTAVRTEATVVASGGTPRRLASTHTAGNLEHWRLCSKT
jgi:hypothetical protein